MKALQTRGVLSSGPSGLTVHGIRALKAYLPPELHGLSAQLGERAVPIISRWQARLGDDDS
jgi:hypothetical protein